MQRRRFITLLSGAAAWPLAARAQQAGMPVVGMLSGVSFGGVFTEPVDKIRQGLKETGFIESQNLFIEYRSAEGYAERLPALAVDLVQRPVAVIIAIGGSAAARAAKAATSTIPIVFSVGADPIDADLVKSISRPEGNVTGMSFTLSRLAPKRLGLLRELMPQAKLIGYLDNDATASEAVRNDLVAAAHTIGQEIVIHAAGTEEEIDRAFTTMVQQRVDALIVSADAFLNTRRQRIIALAARHMLPTIYSVLTAAEQGGLMTYSVLTDDMNRYAGIYAGRLLKGAKPGDLPVMLPTQFKFAINMKTAKTLGLTVPLALQIAADELID